MFNLLTQTTEYSGLFVEVISIGSFNLNYLNVPLLLISESSISLAATIIGSFIVLGGLVWNLSSRLTKLEGKIESLEKQLTLSQYYADRTDKLNEQLREAYNQLNQSNIRNNSSRQR
jgi:hypothetical protein